jgi:hypothetical protein
MEETRSRAPFGADGGLFLPAAPEAREQVSSSSDALVGRLLAILTLQAAAFVLLTASGKIPAVVLSLFRALLTF